MLLGKNSGLKELNSRKKQALYGGARVVTASTLGGGSGLCIGRQRNISHRWRDFAGTKENHSSLGPGCGMTGQVGVLDAS